MFAVSFSHYFFYYFLYLLIKLFVIFVFVFVFVFSFSLLVKNNWQTNLFLYQFKTLKIRQGQKHIDQHILFNLIFYIVLPF